MSSPGTNDVEAGIEYVFAMLGNTIATCGGYAMVEVGPRIYFVDRGTDAHGIALFVLGLVAGIAGINAVVQISLGNGVAALIIGAVGGLFAAVFVVVLRARRRRLALSWDKHAQLAFIDLQSGSAHDGAGRPLAPLTHVGFAPVFQIASSSQALAMNYPGGSTVIARGSPFSGSIDDFTDALRARGLRA